MLEYIFVSFESLVDGGVADSSGVESLVLDICVGDFGVAEFEEVVDCLVHAVSFVEVDGISSWAGEAVDGDIGDCLLFEFVEVSGVSDLECDCAVDAP